MDRLEKLELFLDHFENSPYKKKPNSFDIELQGGNPGCGDVVTIYLKLREDQTVELYFQGEGCSISQASTSILLESLQNKKITDLENIDINYLIGLIGKDIYLLRPNCASLGLNVLKAALKKYNRLNQSKIS